MSGVLRTIARRTAPMLRGNTVTQTANIQTAPPKGKVGVFETTVGIGMLSLAILGPSGWVLAHLEEYKKKD